MNQTGKPPSKKENTRIDVFYTMKIQYTKPQMSANRNRNMKTGYLPFILFQLRQQTFSMCLVFDFKVFRNCGSHVAESI